MIRMEELHVLAVCRPRLYSRAAFALASMPLQNFGRPLGRRNSGNASIRVQDKKWVLRGNQIDDYVDIN